MRGDVTPRSMIDPAARRPGRAAAALAVLLLSASLAWVAASAGAAGAAEPGAAEPGAAEPGLPSLCGRTPVGTVALVNDTALGPDGNVWYTSGLSMVGKVTPAGIPTSYGIPGGRIPVFITAGPDDDVWFTLRSPSAIGRMTTDGDLTIVTDGIAPGALLGAITLGPDGHLWFGSPGAIGELTPGGTVTYHPLADPSRDVRYLAFGPDGELWFSSGNAIGRRDPDGTITLVPTTTSPDAADWPLEVLVGSDGDVWYSIPEGRVGRLTAGGAVTEQALAPAPVPGVATAWALAVDPGADGGTYRLGVSVGGGEVRETAPLAFDADGSTVRDAVAALPNVGAGHVSVTGNVVSLDPLGPANAVALTVTDDSVTDGGAAAATPTTVTLQPSATSLQSITLAADGSVWFGERLTGRIGRVTADGAVGLVTTLTSSVTFPLPSDDPDDPGFDPTAVAVPMLPTALTLGADGNVWLVTVGLAGGVSMGGIGRLAPDGTFTTWSGGLPALDIAVGPDGAAWSTGNVPVIGSVTATGATQLLVRQHVAFDGPLAFAGGIAVGSDGNLWLTAPVAFDGRFSTGEGAEVDGIVRVTPAGEPTLFAADAGITPDSEPAGIVAGPDGALWFTEPGANQIGRITTDGTVTELGQGITRAPQRIAVGGDGNLWFTEGDPGAPRYLGRITPDGVVTELDPGVADDSAILALTGGPDGNVWFAESSGTSGRIGRITPEGTVTWFPVELADLALISSITAGADGALWFSPITAGPPYSLGRITTDGDISYYDVTPEHVAFIPGTAYFITDLAPGPDGALWVGASSAAGIMRTTVPDQVGDPCDHDQDRDGHADYPGQDAFPLDPTEWDDSDADGVGDNVDNCVTAANPSQSDADDDGVGDACDREVFLVGLRASWFTLDATLVDSQGQRVAGARIDFFNRAGYRLCATTTGTNGVARCPFLLAVLMPWIGGFEARFAGDALHDPARAHTWR